jgi:hypothetical protein
VIVDRLLDSDEPSIRWKTRVHVLGEDPAATGLRELQEEIRSSARVTAMLARHVAWPAEPPIYAKWQGIHWVLHELADIGYPAGDAALAPLMDRVVDAWLAPEFFEEFEATSKSEAYRRRAVPVMEGRHRRCASQQGNPLLAMIRLGLVNDRAQELVERLLHWQWPDGGWNCDKEPSADTSSFMETLPPMRALAAWSVLTGDEAARRASERAVDVFLSRQLYKQARDGRVIHAEFTKLHYPLYWHYDILHGLKAMAELGVIGDPGCSDAIDLLESKRLADGGWPAEASYYRHAAELKLGNDDVDWGGTSSRRFNPWVTVDALSVLRAAGRLDP